MAARNAEYFNKNKEKNLRAIDEAVEYLISKKLEITRKAIAEETGIAYRTLSNPPYRTYIEDLIHNQKLSLQKSQEDLPIGKENERLKKVISKKDAELRDCKNLIRQLREEKVEYKERYEKARNCWEQYRWIKRKRCRNF